MHAKGCIARARNTPVQYLYALTGPPVINAQGQPTVLSHTQNTKQRCPLHGSCADTQASIAPAGHGASQGG